jgi:hypothetical protein
MRSTYAVVLTIAVIFGTAAVYAARLSADPVAQATRDAVYRAANPLSVGAARWGEEGHRMIGRVAAERLPADMPDFFRAAAEQLAYLNPEPDRWRARDERALDGAMDAKHAPEHYINFERLSPGSIRAANRLAFADSLRAVDVAAGTAGLLPWRILELTQRLRVAFRDWRAATDPQERAFIEQRIVNDAGILGHYVADGSNPHHTTIHHNGWVGPNPRSFTTDRNFHSRFESVFVRRHISVDDLRATAGAPPALRDPLRPAVWTFLEQSHGRLERLYELDNLEPFGARTRSPAHREFALERLSAGADMLRDLWYTAWITSREGRPGR